MSDDDKIVELGVKFKNPKDEQKMLSLVPKYEGCFDHAYVIDAEANEVSCSKCKKTFNPMAVLVDLAKKESRWMYHHKRYNEEMKRLSERQKTKCRHCGKMTRISSK